MLLRGEGDADALEVVWLDRVLGFLIGGLPFLEAEVSAQSFCLRWRKAGGLFEEAPFIAIEHRRDKKFVVAVGDVAKGLEGASNVSVHNPFHSVEPVFAEYDFAAAYVQHAIRKVLSIRRTFITPNLVLTLKDRKTSLSEAEAKTLSTFAKDCGILRIYILLGGQGVPLSDPINHKDLVEHADRIVFANA